MSTADLERELARHRDASARRPPSNALRLSVEDALAFRNAGNFPDEMGRTLRLVLHVGDAADATRLEEKRLRYEPDFHDAPAWRRPGSARVTVVPLRAAGAAVKHPPEAWWDDPDMAALEEEWRSTGTAAGMVVPGEWRGFVFKTAVALRRAGRDVTPESVGDSVARWLSAEDAARLRAVLEEANR